MKLLLTALPAAVALCTVFADEFRWEPGRYPFAALFAWLAWCVWRSEG